MSIENSLIVLLHNYNAPKRFSTSGLVRPSVLRRRTKHRIIILGQVLIWRTTGIEPGAAPANMWPCKANRRFVCASHLRTTRCVASHHQSGRVPAPRHPMTKERLRLSLWKLIDQKGEVGSPFMDLPSTKGACHSPSGLP